MERKAGFGTPTGVGLPGENPGIVPPPSQWSASSLATMSFGQGVSVTPIAMARYYCAIANGGLLMQPHIVRAVYDQQGNLVRRTSPARRSPRVLRANGRGAAFVSARRRVARNRATPPRRSPVIRPRERPARRKWSSTASIARATTRHRSSVWFRTHAAVSSSTSKSSARSARTTAASSRRRRLRDRARSDAACRRPAERGLAAVRMNASFR